MSPKDNFRFIDLSEKGLGTFKLSKDFVVTRLEEAAYYKAFATVGTVTIPMRQATRRRFFIEADPAKDFETGESIELRPLADMIPLSGNYYLVAREDIIAIGFEGAEK